MATQHIRPAPTHPAIWGAASVLLFVEAAYVLGLALLFPFMEVTMAEFEGLEAPWGFAALLLTAGVTLAAGLAWSGRALWLARDGRWPSRPGRLLLGIVAVANLALTTRFVASTLGLMGEVPGSIGPVEFAWFFGGWLAVVFICIVKALTIRTAGRRTKPRRLS